MVSCNYKHLPQTTTVSLEALGQIGGNKPIRGIFWLASWHTGTQGHAQKELHSDSCSTLLALTFGNVCLIGVWLVSMLKCICTHIYIYVYPFIWMMISTYMTCEFICCMHSERPVYRHTGILVYRHTGIPVYWYTGLPVYRYTGILVYRHTDILAYRYTERPA